jgi:hypothetical protein
MTDDVEKVRARYRLDFLASVQQHIARGLRLVESRDIANAQLLADELHTLAERASVLGLDSLATVAFAGEEAARLWDEQRSDAAIRICSHSLQTMSETLVLLEQLGSEDFIDVPAPRVRSVGTKPMRARRDSSVG